MIRAALDVQRVSPDALADGITSWMRGDDSHETDAASIVVAETILYARGWLKSHTKER